MNTTLREAKRLHRLGGAIHWLHPKSKRPLESGWTTGPRKSWDYLTKTYHDNYNVGVRLGTPSKIGEHYLAVVDVDVKSTEDRHRLEALAAAKRATNGIKCPVVLSGRGNGSRHLYCVTAEPFKTCTPYQSKELVMVMMPSKKPSRREIEELTEKQIADGWRKAPAWEVSLYSEGRQVVLPPSIHPDSGKPYAWAREFQKESELPLIDFKLPEADSYEKGENSENIRAENVKASTLKGFAVTPVDLEWLPLSDKIRDGILHGTDVDDRSAFLLPACTALVSAGLSTNEVLTVLTDKKTFMGAAAWEHSGNSTRGAAANWVWRYSLEKILGEKDPVAMFSGVAVERSELTGEALEAQTLELLADIETPKDRGFYRTGARGAKYPEYDALLKYFNETRPFKTIADMKAVYAFNGTHFEHISEIEVKAFAEENFKPAPLSKVRTEFFVKVLANNVTNREFFTRTTESKINFKNGILDLDNDLKTQTLLPHSPEFGFRGVLPYDFDPNAKCPIFTRWISDLMLGDKELIKILQEFMGYIVRGGEYKYHKALWLGGVGRNGKSTFIDLLKALIGTGNFSTISIKSLVGDRFIGADLDGKIANFSEETSPQELADSGPFKNLTGDGDISAQKKYGDPFHFRNRAKLVMTYNQIPDLKDLSSGMLSRPLIIPFKKIIRDDEQDRSIKKKLFQELSGIFNFALEGLQRLEAQNGFTKSHASEKALAKIKDESCNVTQWMKNHLIFLNEGESERHFKPHELYSFYTTKERFPYKSVEFFRRLNKHPEMAKRRKRTSQGIEYFNLEIQR